MKWMLAAVVLFAVGFAVVRFVQRVLDVPSDAYAMWAAEEILIDYMSDRRLKVTGRGRFVFRFIELG